MKPTDIITIARQQSNVTIDTVTEAQAFMYLNIVIQDFWRDIANREKMYEEVTQTDNTVGGTATYALDTPDASAETFGVLKITDIYIKMQSTHDYVQCELINREQFAIKSKDPTRYADNQPESEPFAMLGTNEITIYPTPGGSVTNGLKITGPKSSFDLSATTTDAESVILIEPQYHRVIVNGLKRWFYGARGSDFIQQTENARQIFNQNKLEAISQMSDRNMAPVIGDGLETSVYY